MIRNLLALLGLATIGLIAAIALQASGYLHALPDDGDRPRIRVSYDGLDLASPEGVRLLERRIDRAIDRICGNADVTDLGTRNAERKCRREAIASVDPQVRNAVDAARDRVHYPDRYDDAPPPPPAQRYDDVPPPAPRHHAPESRQPVFAPMREVVQPLPPEYAGRTLRRRTVTTVTTTTTRASRPVPSHARPLPAPDYRRLPPVPGSWMSPAAWRAVERATGRAFALDKTVRWSVPDREGYVTVSEARWRNGCPCRSVRVVKYAPGRQIVVAEGTRCRLPGGGLTG